jgi:hypothetical protein
MGELGNRDNLPSFICFPIIRNIPPLQIFDEAFRKLVRP